MCCGPVGILTRCVAQVVIPRIKDIIHYIDSELSEIEREEIFRWVACLMNGRRGLSKNILMHRIKKVLEVKRKHEAEEKAIQAQNAKDAKEEGGEVKDLVGGEDEDVDDDVIF